MRNTEELGREIESFITTKSLLHNADFVVPYTAAQPILPLVTSIFPFPYVVPKSFRRNDRSRSLAWHSHVLYLRGFHVILIFIHNNTPLLKSNLVLKVGINRIHSVSGISQKQRSDLMIRSSQTSFQHGSMKDRVDLSRLGQR